MPIRWRQRLRVDLKTAAPVLSKPPVNHSIDQWMVFPGPTHQIIKEELEHHAVIVAWIWRKGVQSGLSLGSQELQTPWWWRIPSVIIIVSRPSFLWLLLWHAPYRHGHEFHPCASRHCWMHPSHSTTQKVSYQVSQMGMGYSTENVSQLPVNIKGFGSFQLSTVETSAVVIAVVTCVCDAFGFYGAASFSKGPWSLVSCGRSFWVCVRWSRKVFRGLFWPQLYSTPTSCCSMKWSKAFCLRAPANGKNSAVCGYDQLFLSWAGVLHTWCMVVNYDCPRSEPTRPAFVQRWVFGSLWKSIFL